MGYGLSATFGSNGPGESSNNANYHTEDDNTAITSSKPSLNPIHLAQDMAMICGVSVAQHAGRIVPCLESFTLSYNWSFKVTIIWTLIILV
jgi:hypothetical protein